MPAVRSRSPAGISCSSAFSSREAAAIVPRVSLGSGSARYTGSMKKLITTLIAAGAAISVAGIAPAAGNTAGEQARIPFSSSVRDFRADGRNAIYIQDVHGQWYRGTFIAPCTDLPFATAIGFNDRGVGGLDKWGTIYVRGTRCQLNSLVKSSPPPSKRHKKQQTQAHGTSA